MFPLPDINLQLKSALRMNIYFTKHQFTVKSAFRTKYIFYQSLLSLVVLGQSRAMLVASVICFQKIFGLHGVNHQILQYSEKEKVIMDKQTERQTNPQTEFLI